MGNGRIWVIIIDTSNEICFGDSDIHILGLDDKTDASYFETNSTSLMIEAVEKSYTYQVVILMGHRTWSFSRSDGKGVQLCWNYAWNCLENLSKPSFSSRFNWWDSWYVTLSDGEAKRVDSKKSILDESLPSFRYYPINNQTSWTIHENVKTL
jgi:hypothetical protein